MARMEAARQANAAADLRAAVDSVQTTVRDARAQLAPCASTQPEAGAHGGHMMPMTPTAPGAKPSDPPMDHSKMPMGGAAAVKPAAGGKAAPAAPMDHSKMQMGPAPGAKPATAGKSAAPAPMDHSKMQMGSESPAKPAPAKGAKPAAPAAPMDHSKMSMDKPAGTSAQATDPVCGLKVDPATTPRATYRGQTYSFCSVQHQQLFQKSPAKYLPKGQ